MRQHTVLLIAVALSLGFAPAPPLPDPGRNPEGYLCAVLRGHGKVDLPRPPCVIEARKVAGRQLGGVLVRQVYGPNRLLTVRAAQAELRVDRGRKRIILRLRRGETELVVEGLPIGYARFEEDTWELPLPKDLGKR